VLIQYKVLRARRIDEHGRARRARRCLSLSDYAAPLLFYMEVCTGGCMRELIQYKALRARRIDEHGRASRGRRAGARARGGRLRLRLEQRRRVRGDGGGGRRDSVGAARAAAAGGVIPAAQGSCSRSISRLGLSHRVNMCRWHRVA
jgi:hypothetical protein